MKAREYFRFKVIQKAYINSPSGEADASIFRALTMLEPIPSAMEAIHLTKKLPGCLQSRVLARYSNYKVGNDEVEKLFPRLNNAGIQSEDEWERRVQERRKEMVIEGWMRLYPCLDPYLINLGLRIVVGYTPGDHAKGMFAQIESLLFSNIEDDEKRKDAARVFAIASTIKGANDSDDSRAREEIAFKVHRGVGDETEKTSLISRILFLRRDGWSEGRRFMEALKWRACKDIEVHFGDGG